MFKYLRQAATVIVGGGEPYPNLYAAAPDAKGCHTHRDHSQKMGARHLIRLLESALNPLLAGRKRTQHGN